MPTQTPALNRPRSRDRITFKVAGSEYGEEWKDYRVECKAIVVWTFGSDADCLRHSKTAYLGDPLLPNPENPCELIEPIRWRVYHSSLKHVFAERENNGPPKIVGHTRTAAERERVHRGLALIGCLLAERRRKQKAFKDAEELEARIVEAFTKVCIEGTRAGREVHYSQDLIAEKLGYTARYIFRDLFPLFELDPAKVKQKATSTATARLAAIFG
jgi:hypothetical protein